MMGQSDNGKWEIEDGRKDWSLGEWEEDERIRGVDRTKDRWKDWRMRGRIKDGTMDPNRRMEG